MHPREPFSHALLSTKRRRQLDTTFEHAKSRLNTHQTQGPFVIATRVSQSIFDAWDDDNKAAWGLAYDAESQAILMYGDSGAVHSGICGYWLAAIGHEIGKLSQTLSAEMSIKSSTAHAGRENTSRLMGLPQTYGRTTMYTEMGAKSPDGSFYVAGFGARSVVLEVAHRNESLKVLQQEVAWWHAAGVGLVLGIYIDVNSDKSNPMLILLSHALEHSGLKQHRFGRDSGCTAYGLPEFQLQIPVKFLLDSSLPEVLDKCISLDLYEIQQRVIGLMKVAVQ